MCKSHNPRKIDKCMAPLISYLQYNGNIKTVACCCGHGKYPMTIVVKHMNNELLEICSYKFILRKTRIYKKDKEGYYYIPEIIEEK